MRRLLRPIALLDTAFVILLVVFTISDWQRGSGFFWMDLPLIVVLGVLAFLDFRKGI